MPNRPTLRAYALVCVSLFAVILARLQLNFDTSEETIVATALIFFVALIP